ncbi:MAG: EF-hand domain-containing protein [Neomegalonema sp.]|nr:EF-hand domain-containing protein [Neomegalonema sp.]
MLSAISGGALTAYNPAMALNGGRPNGAEPPEPKSFSDLDTDSGGFISVDELSSVIGSTRGPSAESIFSAMDTDGDGGVSETEHAEFVETIKSMLSDARADATTGTRGASLEMGPPPPPPPGGPGGPGGKDEEDEFDILSLFDTSDAEESDESDESSSAEAASSTAETILDQMISAMDTDNDGSVSKDEGKSFAEAMLSAIRERLGAQAQASYASSALATSNDDSATSLLSAVA